MLAFGDYPLGDATKRGISLGARLWFRYGIRKTPECDSVEARARGTDRLYSRSARGTGADRQTSATEARRESQRRNAQGRRLGQSRHAWDRTRKSDGRA